ncbi:S-adenosyl-L-methionine-dependent methyltransferase [Copromyces sp. CBS 386.78]|nr:S-adenosyl-L-methionine-dependent methyltransferase [Copromyces sp. CBS 386.78]
MSIFGRSTYSSAGYAAFRPSYPSVLYDRVLRFHGIEAPSFPSPPPSLSAAGTLLDLGCGHGLVARALTPYFSRVTALDPSAGMVEQAHKLSADNSKITVKQGGAEDLSFLADNAVDCVVAGQAAHWFDYSKVWPALARVVKRGGTLAFWGYKDHIIVGQPETTPIFDKFIYGETEPVPGVESMMRFWEQPGRNILRESYQEVVPPETEWEHIVRIAWDPDRVTGDISEAPEEATWLRRRLKLGELEGYLRTFSAFSGWRSAHPDMKSRADGGDGDIVDWMFDEVVAAVPEWKAAGGRWAEIEVDAIWGTILLMAKRR